MSNRFRLSRLSNEIRPQLVAVATLTLTVLSVSGAAPGAVVVSTWAGGATGSWNVAGNWTPAGIPNNGGGNTYQVIVDGSAGTSSAVSLLGSVTIDTLSIGGNDQVGIGNAITLALAGGSLFNDGLLTIGATVSATDLRVDANTDFMGSGVVRGSSTTANRLYASSGTLRLTNQAGHTIAGSMQFGLNQLRLTNEGLIDSDSAAGMVMDLSDGAGLHFNSGTIRASAGSVLSMQAFSLDGTGGLIEATSGGRIDLNSVTINGGTIQDSDGPGPSVVRAIAASVLNNVSVQGPFLISNGVALGIGGSIDLAGNLVLGAAASATDLRIDTSPFVLQGGGAVVTTNTQSNRLYGASGTFSLQIAPDAAVRGAMQFGLNQLRLDNQGLIDADLPAGMTMDLSDGAGINFNTGTIRSSGGGTLQMNPLNLDNTGGLIEAGPGSVVQFNGLTITGGTIRDADGAGAGEARLNGTAVLNGVTLDGPFRVPNGTTLILAGAPQILDDLKLDAALSATDLRFDTTPLTLGGGGRIVCSNTQSNRLYGQSGSHALHVPPDFTIQGAAQFGVNQLRLQNQGLIVADSSAGITMNLSDGAGINSNSGILRAGNGATLALTSFQIANAGGLIEAEAASTVTLNNVTIVGGSLRDVDGAGPGQVRCTSVATLESVAVEGQLGLVNGGLLVLRDSMDLQGALVSLATVSTTDVRTDTPTFEFTGGGEVVFTNSQVNRLYAASGTFRIINGVGNTIRGGAQIGVNQTAFTNLGSIIDDGLVDGADLGGMLGAWGPCTEECCKADLNGDGEVDGSDLGILLGAWSPK